VSDAEKNPAVKGPALLGGAGPDLDRDGRFFLEISLPECDDRRASVT